MVSVVSVSICSSSAIRVGHTHLYITSASTYVVFQYTSPRQLLGSLGFMRLEEWQKTERFKLSTTPVPNTEKGVSCVHDTIT